MLSRRYAIASVSWGKDSLYMLIQLILRDYPLDEVVFYDTGMEFKAIYDTRNAYEPLLAKLGIKYTEIKPFHTFRYNMFDRIVSGRNGQTHYGYSWCGGRCRWGTTEKLRALDKYCEERNAIVYIGLAADETKRLARKHKAYKRYPLADWGITEADALQGCYHMGYQWREGGLKLYDLLDRVSCWCCANKNLNELRNIYRYLPDYWAKLKDLQTRTERPFKGPGKSVFELEARFAAEIKSTAGTGG